MASATTVLAPAMTVTEGSTAPPVHAPYLAPSMASAYHQANASALLAILVLDATARAVPTIAVAMVNAPSMALVCVPPALLAETAPLPPALTLAAMLESASTVAANVTRASVVMIAQQKCVPMIAAGMALAMHQRKMALTSSALVQRATQVRIAASPAAPLTAAAMVHARGAHVSADLALPEATARSRLA